MGSASPLRESVVEVQFVFAESVWEGGACAHNATPEPTYAAITSRMNFAERTFMISFLRTFKTWNRTALKMPQERRGNYPSFRISSWLAVFQPTTRIAGFVITPPVLIFWNQRFRGELLPDL